MLFPVRKWDSRKNSTRRLEENGPKPKPAATEAYNSGPSWTLPVALLDSRLHCHACPRLADTKGRCQGRELSNVHNSLCPSLWTPVPGTDIPSAREGRLLVPLAAGDPGEQESGFWSLLYLRGTLTS